MTRSASLKTLLAIVLLLSFACARQNRPGAVAPAASGFIEARSYRIVSESGGTVAEISNSQGDLLLAGQRVLRLESPDLQSALAESELAVAAALAALAQLEQSPQPPAVASAAAAVARAEADFKSAEISLALLLDSYAPQDPPSLALHAAQGALDIAAAGLELARAEERRLLAGPPEGELIIARAVLGEARAVQARIELQLDRLTLSAPVGGRVTQRLINPGENALPGALLVQLVDESALSLRVFLPLSAMAGVRSGDPVRIRVDAYPEVDFSGFVRRIADQAQFTPTILQTAEERVKLVFAIEIAVDASSGLLKAGMPADVVFIK